jgi:hypothetical protein
MNRLPADVLMLINKFAYGSPTARLIKESPKWKVNLQVSDHFAYSNEEEYWNDSYRELETKWLHYFEDDDSLSDEEYNRQMDWFDRYLDKFF